MQLTAADLFAGCGGTTLAATLAGVKVLWASNHWPLACITHAINHPGVNHVCQDLNLADWTAVPKHHILCASPECIPGYAKVVLGNGHSKLAKDLKIGDLVLTHQGRGRPIVNRWEKLYTGYLFNFYVYGDTKHKLPMTADHRVWVRQRKYLGGPLKENAEFVRADEVKVGDYVAFPRNPENSRKASDLVVKLLPPNAKIVLQNSLDLWWLIGHYLGDGTARKDRPDIGWCVGNSRENLDRVMSILKTLGLKWWLRGIDDQNETIYTSSKHLYALCMLFGRTADAKGIPTIVAEIEHENIEQMLEGYFAADGYEMPNRDNTVRATSVSIQLLQGFQRLAWILGWSANISINNVARKSVIEGRTVFCRDIWELSAIRKPRTVSRTKFNVWRSIKAIETERVSDLPVFDFEVEEDHTFCLPGMIVHNCKGHTRARGKDQKYHDKSRATAWAVIDAAEVCQPPFLIVENVPEFRNWRHYGRWKACLEEDYHLAENILDAADFGVPQHRVRLFLVGAHKKVSKFSVVVTPLRLPHTPAKTIIDWDDDGWSTVAGHSPNTILRIENGRRQFGRKPFLIAYYGNSKGGRSLERPIGSVTTRDRYALVDGKYMRMLTCEEYRRAMGFPDGYILPKNHGDALTMLGNAVVPAVASYLIRQIQRFVPLTKLAA